MANQTLSAERALLDGAAAALQHLEPDADPELLREYMAELFDLRYSTSPAPPVVQRIEMHIAKQLSANKRPTLRFFP